MLIGHSNIRRRDVVLEIGAGSGVITYALTKKCRTVIAAEPDRETARKLCENLARRGVEVRNYAEFRGKQKIEEAEAQEALKTAKSGKNHPVVYLAEEDFLEMELPEGEYKVFANPPFHLSSAIVHKLLEAENPPKSFYLILQKQFALKLLMTDRHYTSQLGRELVQKYQTKIKYPLKPTDFTPPPAVPTVLFEAKKI